MLSHVLDVSTPSFEGGLSLKIEPLKEIGAGASSNSYTLTFPNHLGTHADAPKHVDERGKSLAEYPIEAFVFDRPILLDLPKGESELILPSELSEHEDEVAEADLLLIRTGFQKYRRSDPDRFMNRNPGFSEAAARYVSNFPRLRALGLDFISLSAVQRREEGRAAHRALLSGRDFFVVEDMDLARCPRRPRRVIMVPLLVSGVDSAPCTVLAEV